MSTLYQLLPAEAFWRQELKGFRAPTPLVIDRAHGAEHGQNSGCAEAEVRLSETMTLALKSLAQEHESTLNTLVKGAWALLLSRYSSEEDIVFGVARARRQPTLKAAESMVELLVNPLPIRIHISPDQLLLSWLKKLQAQCTTSQEYSYVSLAKVQEWSDIPPGTALFESLLVFEDHQVNSARENRESQPLEQTSFPLIVTAHDGSEFTLKIKYNCQRFDPAAITRMLGHLQTLLAGMVTNPNQRLLDLPLLTDAEQHQLLVEWNDTQRDYQKDVSIHQLFEAQVGRTPEAVAVVFENQQLTYWELNARANQLAHHLQKLGVGPEVLVGICVERSLEMVVGLLGILKAGGAYVPLDPAYPEERLAFMLEDARVPVLLTQQQQVGGLPKSEAKVVCLDADWEAIARESQENPVKRIMTENLAYVIYTSGSTGKPKGVMIQHRSLVNFIETVSFEYALVPGDRVLQFASINFDASVEEIFSCLARGATLVLRTDAMLSSIPRFLQKCRDFELTVLDLPTAFWHQLTAELSATGLVLPESVRLVIIGGESALPQWLANWQKHVDRQVRLMNSYGPTEATVAITVCDLSGLKKDVSIHQLFEAQVEQTPDAVAVIFEDQQLTYRQLNRRANQLAHRLQALGVGPEVLVGICAERSLEMVVGLLGILKAGGAYVPLDPAYPQERLEFMLQDSQVPVLLTQKQLVARLPEHQAHVICLDTDWEDIAQESGENPVSSVKSENLAYVIYTSGSTGRPKGVAMKQLPLVNLIVWQLDNSTVSSGAKTLQFAPVSFDVSFQEIFSTWCSGGALVLLSEKVRRDPAALLRLLGETEVERLFLPFVALQQLAEVAVTAKLMPTSLREIITAGEQLQTTPPIVSLFMKLTGCILHNHYGPSESHVVTSFTLTGSANSWPTLPSIGRPIANTQIYLLDQSLQPVPIGIPGELHIGGVCLARGYINRPDLTKERFIPNPFSNAPEARLYKTGDLARYLPTGDIEYLGRIDNQVKIRGFRIELGEIEAVLAQYPAAQQVAVIAREDHPGNKHLVAYVVPNQEQVPAIKELRRFLNEKLPDYMVPSAYVILDTIPLTPSGKLDRRALPAPDQTRSELAETFVAPQDQVELQLTEIWQEVLGIQPIGIRDNFFELGGHSLLAARLFTEIERSFAKNLPLATLFQAATIEKLANILRQEEWSAPWSSLVTIQAGSSKPPLFCIHGGGFNLLVYRDLANYLGPDQPVYGLQAQGLDGETSIHWRFEDMATDYIKHIQTVQPEGPYLLAGLSSGGTIALEMAQQLRAQGQKVALLAMFDTHGPDNFLKVLPPTSRLFSVLVYALCYTFPRFIGKRLQLGPKAILTSVLKEVRTASQWVSDDHKSRATARQLEAVGMTNGTGELARNSTSYLERQIHTLNMWIVERSELAYLAPQAKVHGLGGTLSEAVQKLEAAHVQAELSYVHQVCLDRITLFRAKEQLPGFYRDPQHGWGRIAAGGLEIYDVPGYHVDVVKSPVIAETMRACIDKALARVD